MRKRFGFKPPIAVTQRQNKQQLLALAHTDEQRARIERDFPEENMRALPKPRAAPRQLEAPVVQAVGELLALHPKVLFAVRQNSGMASYEAKSGKYAPVFFYRILTSQPVTITDFWGILRDGRPFCLEAKAPGFKGPRSEREVKQALFISLIQNCGGVGGFVTSADEANALLA